MINGGMKLKIMSNYVPLQSSMETLDLLIQSLKIAKMLF